MELEDQLSDSQLQVLDAAPTDTTTRFSDVLFPDGSNISDWSVSNDSGYVFTFNRGSSIQTASDKKNLFISRMTGAGLILADDIQCSCLPSQPNGLAYVHGSKHITTTHLDPIAVCQQPLYGLDCSGMIYQMANQPYTFLIYLAKQ